MLLPFLPLVNLRLYLLACLCHYLPCWVYYWLNLLVLMSQNGTELWNWNHWGYFRRMVIQKVYCDYLFDVRVCQIWSRCAKVLFVLSTHDRAISQKFATCNLVGGLGWRYSTRVYFLFEVLFLHMFVVMWQMDLELNMADISSRQTWIHYIVSLYRGRYRRYLCLSKISFISCSTMYGIVRCWRTLFCQRLIGDLLNGIVDYFINDSIYLHESLSLSPYGLSITVVSPYGKKLEQFIF